MSKSGTQNEILDTAGARDLLQRFASYINECCLDEFVKKNIELVFSFDISVMKYVAHLTEEEIFSMTKQTVIDFLDALISNEYEHFIQNRFQTWEDDQLDYIKRDQISLQDISQINSAQKLTLFFFIHRFTQNPAEMMEIVQRLELMYQHSQTEAISILQRLQQEREEKLSESEERYKDLFDNASDMIQFVGPEGNLLYANNAWKHILGYTEDELKGKSIFFFISEPDRDRYKDYRSQIINGTLQHEEIRMSFISKDNREVIVEGSTSPKFKNGEFEYTRGIFRDVTRRVQNEQKIHFYTLQVLDREDKMRQLIYNAPDAIIVINEQGVINIWNPKAEEIFGWKAEEVVGSNLAETIIPPQHVASHTKGMQRLLATGEARVLNKTIEVTALRKDGSEFFISLTISRAMLPDGGSLFVSFLRDITAEKKIQQELEQQRIQLERTNTALEQYAWVASHDLKEPLRKIRTFSDILFDSNEITNEGRNKLKKIIESAERMDKLIDAILIYSNSSTEQSVEAVDLNVTIKDVCSDLEILISSKKALLYINELPIIKGNPFQLRQLFQNLLSNALKYSKTDVTPEIHILCSKNNNEYQIEIKDNGIGFKEEFANKIFQVFQRLVTKQEYEGTGIGLALCKKIVENHGGSILAQSKEGEGSSFIISFPAS